MNELNVNNNIIRMNMWILFEYNRIIVGQMLETGNPVIPDSGRSQWLQWKLI